MRVVVLTRLFGSEILREVGEKENGLENEWEKKIRKIFK